MQPLIVLVTVFLLLVLPLGWWTALRIALAMMFLLTASAHWGKRADLIRMVPAGLPRPDLRVTITGCCEILGAVGLLVSRVAAVAALGLTLLLIALFPANVRAARQGITIAGRPATPMPARAVVQIVFLTATIGVMVGAKM